MNFEIISSSLKNRSAKILMMLFLLSSPLFGICQPGGPVDAGGGGGTTGGNPDDPASGVPLEGADILLLAMGAGFVVFKVWQHKHNKKTQAQGIQ
jgi:hypothetical protein